MKPLVALALLAILASGCGGTVVFEEGGEAAGQGGSGGASGEGGAGGLGSATVVTSAQAVSAVDSSAQGVGGAGGTLTPTIVDVKLGADCMPVVSSDPMWGSVLVEYASGSGSTRSLVVARAEVLFATPKEGWVFPVNLSPATSGDVGPGDVVTVEHQKVGTDGDSSFVCQLCGMPGTVTLHFLTESGEELEASGSFELGCAL